MSHMSLSRVTHLNVTHMNDVEWAMSNGPCHTYERVMSRMPMGHVTHMNVPCYTYDTHI